MCAQPPPSVTVPSDHLTQVTVVPGAGCGGPGDGDDGPGGFGGRAPPATQPPGLTFLAIELKP